MSAPAPNAGNALPATGGVVLRRASVRPGTEVDVAIVGGRIVELPSGSERRRWEAVDLEGRPVLPGLADHHVHLLSTAASWTSVDCSPEALVAGGGLVAVLCEARRHRPSGWLRGVGYDVAASGAFDRTALDRAAVGPVRIQDRTGTQRLLDGVALDAVLPTDPSAWPDGVERDAAGHPTGVLVELDRWLGERVPRPALDLAAVGALLAGCGVTAVTDAGAENGPSELAALAAADLPQRMTAMTRDPDVVAPPGIALGPVKVHLDEAHLPPFDELAGRIEAAHQRGRTVAVHCVSEVALALALAAGIDRRDRVEHASLVPEDGLDSLVAAGPTVVVQPGLVATKGDRYLTETPPRDHAGLHRLGSFTRAGLRVAASSDAPYGPLDPWTGVAAAVERRTSTGRRFTAEEAVDPLAAVALWSGRSDDPASRRGVASGELADLVVLDDGWDRLAAHPHVLATIVDGRVVVGALPA